MTTGEALEIVYQLAHQNAIYNSRESWMVEPDDLGTIVDKNLAKEAERQREALNTVHDFIVNNFGKEDAHDS